MRIKAQQTTVHGARDAAEEWRRIIDTAWRHGLAALPLTRPEFAAPTRPGGHRPATPATPTGAA